MSNFHINFGALCPSIKEQLSEQGLVAKDVSHLQKDADAITRLAVRGLLPYSQVRQAQQRLVKKFVVREA